MVKLPLPEIIAREYRGTLLSKILSMQTKSPLSFNAAINFVADREIEAFAAGRMGSNPGQYSWYSENFVQFISELGYHIEMSGDEFEPCIPQSSVL